VISRDGGPGFFICKISNFYHSTSIFAKPLFTAVHKPFLHLKEYRHLAKFLQNLTYATCQSLRQIILPALCRNLFQQITLITKTMKTLSHNDHSNDMENLTLINELWIKIVIGIFVVVINICVIDLILE
jgi:hypothetical protein